MADTKNNKAIKHDIGKTDWSVIKWTSLIPVVEVIRIGNNDYGHDNWLKGDGLKRSRIFSAAMRHLIAWWEGENLDAKTRLPHLAHAIACIMMLLIYQEKGYDNDDRRG